MHTHYVMVSKHTGLHTHYVLVFTNIGLHTHYVMAFTHTGLHTHYSNNRNFNALTQVFGFDVMKLIINILWLFPFTLILRGR